MFRFLKNTTKQSATPLGSNRLATHWSIRLYKKELWSHSMRSKNWWIMIVYGCLCTIDIVKLRYTFILSIRWQLPLISQKWMNAQWSPLAAPALMLIELSTLTGHTLTSSEILTGRYKWTVSVFITGTCFASTITLEKPFLYGRLQGQFMGMGLLLEANKQALQHIPKPVFAGSWV